MKSSTRRTESGTRPVPLLQAATDATHARILVVDDEEDSRRSLERVLRSQGFSTSAAADGEEALEEARRNPPDLVLTDLAMHPMDGLELCKHLHALDEDLPIIVMTGRSDIHSVIGSLGERA